MPVDTLTIFIGSPGDVSAERTAVRRVIEELSASTEELRGCRLKAVGWESDAYANVAVKSPQENINQGLARPSECDISLFLFWGRVGTPLADGFDDRRAELGFDAIPLTGSVWELCDGLTGGNDAARVHIPLWFQCRRAYPQEDDPERQSAALEQQGNVNRLFAAVQRPDDTYRYSVTRFVDIDSLEKELRQQLPKVVGKLLDGSPTRNSQPLVERRPSPPRRTVGGSLDEIKPVDADLCLAHINREPYVDQVRPTLVSARGGVQSRLAVLIAQGSSADWHDGVRIRLQYVGASSLPVQKRPPQVTWTSAGINSLENLENMLWSPLARRLGGEGIGDLEQLTSTVAELVESAAADINGPLVINYEVPQVLFTRMDRKLMGAFARRWRAVAERLERSRVVVLMSLVQDAPPPPVKWHERLRGVIAVSPALVNECFADVFDDAQPGVFGGLVHPAALGPIRPAHLDDWDRHLKQDFQLPNAQRHLLLTQVRNRFGERANVPHETLRQELKNTPEFLQALGAHGD